MVFKLVNDAAKTSKPEFGSGRGARAAEASRRLSTSCPSISSDGAATLASAKPRRWRRLNGENQLPKVVQGVKFQNGIEVIAMPAYHAA